jgi:sn-glycerol 3-phosphate transport system ATP-binding protein
VAEVQFRKVTRRFGADVMALRDLSIDVNDGEFLILVGPSGCGKSTALRILAGLDKPTSGEVWIGGRQVTSLGPGERDIAMVFQNYALYPHMSVYKNLAYGLRQRKVPKADIERQVRETSTMLDIDKLLDRKPAQLSGGQRQRVAMGRALVRRPVAFLLDEPLSNLDAKLRTQVRGDLKRLHAELPITSIYVTHDQVEAMTLGDRICVMSAGEVQQIGTPTEVYDQPANTFVASFMGSPPMNLVPGTVEAGSVLVGGSEVARTPMHNGAVTVGIRPESVVLQASGGVPARVIFAEPLGSHVLVHVEIPPSMAGGGSTPEEPPPVVVQAPPHIRPVPGEEVYLQFDLARTYLFDGETGAALHPDQQPSAEALRR